MGNRNLLIMTVFGFLSVSFAFPQEDGAIIDIGHRVTIGGYNSYRPDNIGILECGYDFIVNFPYLAPDYNLLDFGIGISAIFAYDDSGNPRLPVPGLGINGSLRIYAPAIQKARIFLEGVMSLVVYSDEYPADGTMVNGGWHWGGGFEVKLENAGKLFVKILWFHTSNNDVYGRDRNPAVNALGLAAGMQF